MVEYFNKLSADFDWEKFAKTMKLPPNKRKTALEEAYDDGILPAIRAAVLSQIQSSKAHAGRELENKVRFALDKLKIPYGYQIAVEDDTILDKRPKGSHVLDFVVPNPNAGDSLKDYVVISTKTTLRERFLQDKHLKCKKLIFITHDKDAKTMENAIVIDRVDDDVKAEIDCLVEKLADLKVPESK